MGDLSKLKFKPVVKIQKDTRVSNKLVEGLCILDNDVYKIHVNIGDGSYDSFRLLDFTDDSFNLANRQVVFSKIKHKKFGREMIVRRERTYKYSPGLPSQYQTICEGHIFNGYIVRSKGKLKFKMNRWVRRNGYNKDGQRE